MDGKRQVGRERDGRAGRHGRVSRAGGARRRGAGADCRGPSEIPRRRPARQGGRGEPGAGPRGARRDRPVAAAEADHGEPVARGPAQGRLALRSADRARPARGDGRDRPGDAGFLLRGRRAQPRRAGGAVARRAARRDPRFGARARPDLPGSAGERGGLGRRDRGDRRAGPDRLAEPSARRRSAGRRPGPAWPIRLLRGRTSGR